jgi:AbrB family looped-hinge helix DNA binding protein
METTLDRFGRVVIPKRVREDLGLKVGEPLLIEEHADGILLRPAQEGVPLKRKGRVLVFAGNVAGDPGDLMGKARDERMRKVAGRRRG